MNHTIRTRRQSRDDGFTLIEVVVTVVFLGLVAAVVAAAVIVIFRTEDGVISSTGWRQEVGHWNALGVEYRRRLHRLATRNQLARQLGRDMGQFPHCKRRVSYERRVRCTDHRNGATLNFNVGLTWTGGNPKIVSGSTRTCTMISPP